MRCRLSKVSLGFTLTPNPHFCQIPAGPSFVRSTVAPALRWPAWIDERGTSGDLAEVWVRCECKPSETLERRHSCRPKPWQIVTAPGPWLGPYTKSSVAEPNRLLIRAASNAYFTQQMSVISLPDRDETVKQAVDAAWEFVEARRGHRRTQVRAQEGQSQGSPGGTDRRGGLC